MGCQGSKGGRGNRHPGDNVQVIRKTYGGSDRAKDVAGKQGEHWAKKSTYKPPKEEVREYVQKRLNEQGSYYDRDLRMDIQGYDNKTGYPGFPSASHQVKRAIEIEKLRKQQEVEQEIRDKALQHDIALRSARRYEDQVKKGIRPAHKTKTKKQPERILVSTRPAEYPEDPLSAFLGGVLGSQGHSKQEGSSKASEHKVAKQKGSKSSRSFTQDPLGALSSLLVGSSPEASGDSADPPAQPSGEVEWVPPPPLDMEALTEEERERHHRRSIQLQELVQRQKTFEEAEAQAERELKQALQRERLQGEEDKRLKEVEVKKQAELQAVNRKREIQEALAQPSKRFASEAQIQQVTDDTRKQMLEQAKARNVDISNEAIAAQVEWQVCKTSQGEGVRWIVPPRLARVKGLGGSCPHPPCHCCWSASSPEVTIVGLR